MVTPRRTLTTFNKEFSTVAFNQMLSGVILPDRGIVSHKFYKIWQIVVLISHFFTFFTTMYTAFISYKNSNIVEATRQINLMVLCCFAQIKTLVFHYHKTKFYYLRNTLQEDYRNANDADDEIYAIILEGVKSALFYQKIMIFVMLLPGCAMLGVPGFGIAKDNLISNTAERQLIIPVEFFLKFLNDRKLNSGFFEINCIYTGLTITLIGANFIGFETTFLIYLEHLCAEISVLCLKLTYLFRDNLDLSRYDADLTSRRISEIVRHHTHIIRTGEIIQEAYMAYFLSTSLLGGIVICMSLFQVVQSIEDGTISFFHILVVSTVSVLYLLLNSAQKLIDKCSSLVTAIYDCGWENVPDLPNRRKLVLMLARSQQPITISTGFSIMSIYSFSTIMQTAWNYFMIIYNTSE